MKRKHTTNSGEKGRSDLHTGERGVDPRTRSADQEPHLDGPEMSERASSLDAPGGWAAAWRHQLALLGVLAALLVLSIATGAQAQAVLEARPAGGATRELPLVEERLTVAIDGQHATTVLRHVFQNESADRLEGNYSLMLGESATATGFAYWNSETKIVGEVFEKETARQVYETVTGMNRDPGLLEKTGEGAFSFRVFPIDPSEKKPVEVTAAQWLRRRGNHVEFRAPVTRSDASIVVDLRDERPLGTVTSPTHEIAIDNLSPRHVRIRGVARKGNDASDLVLRYDLDDPPWTLRAAVHRDAGQEAFVVVNLAAPDSTSQRSVPKDVTLVIDRSGSMSGEPLESARRAAASVIRRLKPTDRVNVILFDDGVDELFPSPRAVSEAVRAQALKYVAEVKDGGGTDIAGALGAALSSQQKDEHPDVILFMTDGQSDAQEVLKTARADRGDARVFTVGLGSGVDRPLLSRLAREKRGRFAFIESERRLESAVSDLYRSIEAPVLVDLDIKVNGARLGRSYPKRLPDLFERDELVVAGRVKGDGPATIVVTGRDGTEVRRFEKVVDLGPSKRPWVGRLWAERRVEDLLEEMALAGETDELVGETIELALTYDLVTRYTSFLAIPESELTGGMRDVVQNARESRRRLLAAHPDALALSRSVMPPGDPVLRVRAPKNALQVTAIFPFGLVSELHYDPESEHWITRFLVPKDVSDGDYDVKVLIVEADGTVRSSVIPYTIDSSAPELSVAVTTIANGIRLAVRANEDLREVRVSLVGAASLDAPSGGGATCTDATCTLVEAGDPRRRWTDLRLPPGRHTLRVTTSDRARNEAQKDVEVLVLAPFSTEAR